MNAPINMGFRREVHNGVGRFLTKSLLDKNGIADVALNKPVLGAVRDRLQVFQISRVGELIEHCDARGSSLGQRSSNKSGTDEPRAASYQEFHLCCSSQS